MTSSRPMSPCDIRQRARSNDGERKVGLTLVLVAAPSIKGNIVLTQIWPDGRPGGRPPTRRQGVFAGKQTVFGHELLSPSISPLPTCFCFCLATLLSVWVSVCFAIGAHLWCYSVKLLESARVMKADVSRSHWNILPSSAATKWMEIAEQIRLWGRRDVCRLECGCPWQRSLTCMVLNVSV